MQAMWASPIHRQILGYRLGNPIILIDNTNAGEYQIIIGSVLLPYRHSYRLAVFAMEDETEERSSPKSSQTSVRPLFF